MLSWELVCGCLGALNSTGSGEAKKEAGVTVLIEAQALKSMRGPPVSSAHSISIQKSQSLTLHFDKIDTRETFSPTSLYVACFSCPISGVVGSRLSLYPIDRLKLCTSI